MSNPLTDKQDKFVSEYLIDLNATQAAIRAGYSEKTAYSIGHENLSKPEIGDAIQEARKEAAKRNEVTVDEITAMHRKAFDVAESVEQPSAMTASANNMAKLHGLIIDRSEVTGKDGQDLMPKEISFVPHGAKDKE